MTQLIILLSAWFDLFPKIWAAIVGLLGGTGG